MAGLRRASRRLRDGGGRLGRGNGGIAGRELLGDDELAADGPQGGQVEPEGAAPAMQATPPTTTATGAPNRPARSPANRAPNGAIPMNIIE